MYNNYIEFTEIRFEGFWLWKKEITKPVFINANHVESVRHRKKTGTEIETNSGFYEVLEPITEVLKKLTQA